MTLICKALARFLLLALFVVSAGSSRAQIAIDFGAVFRAELLPQAVAVAPGAYTLRGPDGMALATVGGTAPDRNHLRMAPRGITWQLIQSSEKGYFYLEAGNLFLDVRSSGMAEGTPVYLGPFNGTNAQKWRPVRYGGRITCNPA